MSRILFYWECARLQFIGTDDAPRIYWNSSAVALLQVHLCVRFIELFSSHQLNLLGQRRRILPQPLLLLLLIGEILFPFLDPGALSGSLQDGGGVKGTDHHRHLSDAGQDGQGLLGEGETH